ncbi:hypothetical protein [Neoroseomonas lacus]|nr:hypothetical protein [Neoroseomonas lacus]
MPQRLDLDLPVEADTMPICAKATPAPSRTVMRLFNDASAIAAPPVQASDETFHSRVVIEARASPATFSRTFIAASKRRAKTRIALAADAAPVAEARIVQIMRASANPAIGRGGLSPETSLASQRTPKNRAPAAGLRGNPYPEIDPV